MILTENNFILYAAKYYDMRNCGDYDEFQEDLMRFKYLKKLCYNYRNKNLLKERLILNHLIILYNTFEVHACTKMLILRLNDYLDCIFPFLLMMGYLPEEIKGIYDENWKMYRSDISLDQQIVTKIRENILRKDQNATV